MEGCKLLAFLLCDSASKSSDGKVTLHGLFDRIIVPRGPVKAKLFHVFYKIAIDQPCTVTLRVFDPLNGEISGNWRDRIGQPGLVQSVWALTTSLFKQAGPYGLKLSLEFNGGKILSLADMLVVVDQQGE